METNVKAILKPMLCGWAAFIATMIWMGGPSIIAFVAGLAVSWLVFYFTGFKEASSEMSKILIKHGLVKNAEGQ